LSGLGRPRPDRLQARVGDAEREPLARIRGPPGGLVIIGREGDAEATHLPRLLVAMGATRPLALFGAGGYGLRTGLIAAPARILQGGAPILFGLTLDPGGPFAALTLSFSLHGNGHAGSAVP
jgi:hypothetical protein